MAKSLGDRIRRAREAAGFPNRTRFAELIEVDRNTVGRWEAGRGLPDAQNVEAISRVCAVSADWLLRGQADEAASAVLAEWRRTRGQHASDAAMIYLESLPTAGREVTATFYDLSLIAHEQGLSVAEAAEAARVTEVESAR